MGSAAISVDVREITRLAEILNGAKLRPRDRRQLLINLSVELESSTQERFRTKRDPEGNPWKAVSDEHHAFLAARFPGAEPPLVMRGELADSIESRVTVWEALVGATKVYASVHQDGWDEKNIAARPYLGISPDDEDALAAIAEEFLDDLLHRRSA